jgi:hypothetical protein
MAQIQLKIVVSGSIDNGSQTFMRPKAGMSCSFVQDGGGKACNRLTTPSTALFSAGLLCSWLLPPWDLYRAAAVAAKLTERGA